ncbi:putative ankyrin repeat-containing protein-like isoform 2 [Capsicum annuum]|nr:putative ankyrin repeat-containing protein-like isoform 2 [Capsicum annuum]KAF3624733.1 putative ankyrin repeat-containing protein-like isoform 2 [Capsicum annuum]
MTDASGDTALHKAVRSQHLYVVKLLVKEDSEFEFLPNHEQETPLYLAAESGPSNRTPPHAAVIQEHKDCIRSLWRWNKPLCEEPDLWGWNSLHYAVKLGMEDVVSDMLAWKKSLVYLPVGSENDWTTAIHIAAREDYDEYDSLVDEPDSDGNTPLHLLAASDNHVHELIYHPRAKNMSFNKQNHTPVDIALSRIVTTEKEKLERDLCSIGRFGKRDLEVKQKYEYMPLTKDDRDKAKKAYQTAVEGIMKSLSKLQSVFSSLSSFLFGSMASMVNPSDSTILANNTSHLVQFNPSSQLPLKFTGPMNFVIWKAQVESLMFGHDLYCYLDGTLTTPSKMVTLNNQEIPIPSTNSGFAKTN